MRILSVLIVVLLTGCADLGYYWHTAKGHMAVMHQRVDIDELLADPQTDLVLKERLILVKEIRQFAFGQLALPQSGSYTDYAQLDHPYVLQTCLRHLSFRLNY